MNLRYPSCLALFVWVVLSTGHHARAGTWRDASGNAIAAGHFVSLEANQVRVQVDSGEYVSIPLDRLCPSDQTLARGLAIKPAIHKRVEASSIGTTSEEARHNACRVAVEMAVGVRKISQTVVQNDRLNEKRSFDLTFSDGFVTTYSVLDEHRDGNDYRCKISAVVQCRDFAWATAPTGSTTDAKSIFAEADTKLVRRINGLAIIQQAIDSFTEELLDVRFSRGAVQLIPGDDDHFDVPYTVTVTVSAERYNQFLDRLIAASGALSTYSGVIVADRPVLSDQTQVRSEQIERNTYERLLRQYYLPNKVKKGVKSSFGLLEVFRNPQSFSNLPSTQVSTYKPERPSTLLMIYVFSADVQKSHWQWFQIEEQPKIPGIQLRLFLRYRNKGDRVVSRENVLSIGPGIPGISLSEPAENLHTAIIGPFFIHHEGSGYTLKGGVFPFARTLTVSGKLHLDRTDEARVETIDVGIKGQRLAETLAPLAKHQDAKSEKQQVQMFDGRTLKGWHLRMPEKPNCWHPDNGELICTPKRDAKSADLVSNEVFQNFDLHLEFWMEPSANSGVYLRGLYEVQLFDDSSERVKPTHRCGAIFNQVAPNKKAYLGPKQWNSMDVQLVGKQASVVLNGQKIIDTATISGSTGGGLTISEGQPGPIMLQCHGENVTKFRDIRIAKIGAKSAPAKDSTSSQAQSSAPMPKKKRRDGKNL